MTNRRLQISHMAIVFSAFQPKMEKKGIKKYKVYMFLHEALNEFELDFGATIVFYSYRNI